jgi:hypothetical protein
MRLLREYWSPWRREEVIGLLFERELRLRDVRMSHASIETVALRFLRLRGLYNY